MPDPADAEPPAKRGVNLNWRERLAAGLVGLAGTGAGGAGVFLTENQAGTTAILIVGAAFLLMAVQGTPIRKASKDSVEMADREAAVERVIETAERTRIDDGPMEARAVIEGAVAARPEIRHDPDLYVIDAELYKEQVMMALERMIAQYGEDGPSWGGSLSWNPVASRFTLTLVPARDKTTRVAVEVVYSDTRADVTARVGAAKDSIHDPNLRGVVISNRPLASVGYRALRFDRHDVGVQFAVWAGPENDGSLDLALRRVLGLEAP